MAPRRKTVVTCTVKEFEEALVASGFTPSKELTVGLENAFRHMHADLVVLSNNTIWSWTREEVTKLCQNLFVQATDDAIEAALDALPEHLEDVIIGCFEKVEAQIQYAQEHGRKLNSLKHVHKLIVNPAPGYEDEWAEGVAPVSIMSALIELSENGVLIKEEIPKSGGASGQMTANYTVNEEHPFVKWFRKTSARREFEKALKAASDSKLHSIAEALEVSGHPIAGHIEMDRDDLVEAILFLMDESDEVDDTIVEQLGFGIAALPAPDEPTYAGGLPAIDVYPTLDKWPHDKLVTVANAHLELKRQVAESSSKFLDEADAILGNLQEAAEEAVLEAEDAARDTILDTLGHHETPDADGTQMLDLTNWSHQELVAVADALGIYTTALSEEQLVREINAVPDDGILNLAVELGRDPRAPYAPRAEQLIFILDRLTQLRPYYDTTD